MHDLLESNQQYSEILANLSYRHFLNQVKPDAYIREVPLYALHKPPVPCFLLYIVYSCLVGWRHLSGCRARGLCTRTRCGTRTRLDPSPSSTRSQRARMARMREVRGQVWMGLVVGGKVPQRLNIVVIKAQYKLMPESETDFGWIMKMLIWEWIHCTQKCIISTFIH